jgi:hypothetical protein
VSALVRWLPELAVATADDVARYGRNAARVKTLIDFIPTMSDEASEIAARAYDVPSGVVFPPGAMAPDDAMRRVQRRAIDLGRRDQFMNAAEDADYSTVYRPGFEDSAGWDPDEYQSVADIQWRLDHAAGDAAVAESLSDLLGTQYYQHFTNPLATGRAVDVLRPRYKNTPFRELLQELSPNLVLAQPTDVLGVGRIARSPEAVRDIALQLLKDGGMTVEEAYNAARLLA